MRLKSRLDALEQAHGSTFNGFASIWWPSNQTPAEAKLAWERDNGPIGERQVILWRWPEEVPCA